MKKLCAILLLVAGMGGSYVCAGPPNLLVITVDDMSCDSIGAFGCELPGTTPHIDRLTRNAMSFEYAHVQVGNCFPSRNVMFSGLYPHNHRAEGFYPVKNDYPTFADLLKRNGYYVAIRGKVNHTTPYFPYPVWDRDLTLKEDGSKYHLKDVDSYGTSVATGIKEAQSHGKPFFINVNISDPHKPFWFDGDPHPVSKEFSPEEVPIPGFLFDHPKVRKELALYYNSVRRADDAVGKILEALNASGERRNTVLVFLSDHGMPLPFAKTGLWHHSTRTPLVFSIPGVTENGFRDHDHIVSAVDFVPTFLDLLGLPVPGGVSFDGQSFAGIIRGQALPDRQSVFKVYNENSGARRHPMRAVETRDFLYLWNPWVDGENIFRTATQGTDTYRTMNQLASSNPSIAQRLEYFNHRVPEELYHIPSDPDCLNNLIHSPEHREIVQSLSDRMEQYMVDSNDHALNAFRHRDNPLTGPAYTAMKQAEASVRRTYRRANFKQFKENPGKKGNGDFVIGPDYQIDPDLTDQGNPKGMRFEFSMALADSKIFKGDDTTLDPKKPVREKRRIFVYIPAAYKNGDKAAFMIMHDGPGGLSLVQNALDNLTISKDPERKLPPFIVISVENGGNDSKGSQRGLEYDTMSDRLARFINDEVLPAVLANQEIREAYPDLTFTKNPWGRAAMGCSSGGAAALSMGWFRPDLFRRLVTYSGTFVDQQDDDAPEEHFFPFGAWDYHDGLKLIENSPKKPLRIFTHVSEFDNGYRNPEGSHHNWVKANFQTAAALKAKGYDYRFVFTKDSRHCDRRVFEHTLADTLVWMWRGYQQE